jgi:3-hydroxyisobutyrate dehydrogenase-like beta-hydroxyacid dehydrogenase
MTDVAVLGMGAMGSRMARRLLDAGHRVAVWNRTPDRMDPLLEAGATAVAGPAAAARSCEVVITMLTDDTALRDVTEEPDGVAATATERTTVIQMSTVSPAALARLASTLPPETHLLDAPVLGSLSEVEAGSLRIFVGGGDDDVARWTPLLATLGQPMHVGPVGSGAAAKLVANSTLVGVIGVFGEALALAEGLGLPRHVALDVLATTALGAQVERRRASIESGEYPPRFPLTLAAKDAQLIADAAAAGDIDLRVLEAARTWLAEARDAGWGDQDYSVVLETILGDRSDRPKS